MSAGTSAASLLLALVNNACAVPRGINVQSRHDGGEWLWELVEYVCHCRLLGDVCTLAAAKVLTGLLRQY